MSNKSRKANLDPIEANARRTLRLLARRIGWIRSKNKTYAERDWLNPEFDIGVS